MKAIKNLTLILCLVFLVGCINYSSSNNTKKLDASLIQFDDNTYPVVIIGGGFAGLTASIYLGQANIKHVLIEGPIPGGAITSSHSVCNWPGEKNISGIDLANKVKEHAISTGANIINAQVNSVDFSVWPYLINITQDNQDKTIKTLSCIIATGATATFLDIPGEQEYFGRGVSKCATCDGPFYKNKTVAIIGGGNTAITDALYLSNIAKKVYLIVRRDILRASGKQVDTVKNKSNIEIIYNTNIKKVIGDNNKVTGLEIFNNKNNSTSELSVDGMFLAIGAKPNTELLKNKIDLDQEGYILTHKNQKTSKSGIFACGDVSEPEYKQLIIASGDGARSAMHAQKFLDKIGFVSEYKTEVTQETQEPEQTKEIAKQEIKQEIKKIAPAKTQTFGSVIEITDNEQFTKEVLNYKGKVVADFYAHWCFPCKMMHPIVDALAKELKNIKFVKTDVSNVEILGQIWGVRGVPTFILFEDGQEVYRFSGGRDEAGFKQIIKNKLNI